MRGRITILFMILACLPAAPVAMRGEGDQTKSHFTSYSGDRKCDPGTGGGNQSTGGEKPLDHTWEKPGDGWVMVAVCPSIYQKMNGCTGTFNGKKIKVRDKCPGCCDGGKLSHIDMSHTCKGANMTGQVQWDPGCKGIDEKGQHGKVQTKN